MHRLFDALRRDAVLFVMSILDSPTAVRLSDSRLHGISHFIRIERDVAADITRRASDCLDQSVA